MPRTGEEGAGPNGCTGCDRGDPGEEELGRLSFQTAFILQACVRNPRRCTEVDARIDLITRTPSQSQPADIPHCYLALLVYA